MSKIDQIIEGLKVLRQYHPELQEEFMPVYSFDDHLYVHGKTDGPQEFLDQMEKIGGWRKTVDPVGEPAWCVWT